MELLCFCNYSTTLGKTFFNFFSSNFLIGGTSFIGRIIFLCPLCTKVKYFDSHHVTLFDRKAKVFQAIYGQLSVVEHQTIPFCSKSLLTKDLTKQRELTRTNKSFTHAIQHRFRCFSIFRSSF